MPEVKQVIVIRKDLKMRRGKEIAQASHASMSFITKKLEFPEKSFSIPITTAHFTKTEIEWMKGNFKKICLQVDSEAELMDIVIAAEKEGIACHLITDDGLTEFNGVPTRTCLALGPEQSERLDKITGHLRLY